VAGAGLAATAYQTPGYLAGGEPRAPTVGYAMLHPVHWISWKLGGGCPNADIAAALLTWQQRARREERSRVDLKLRWITA